MPAKEKSHGAKNGYIILGYHAFLLATLPFYFYYAPPGLSMILVTIALWFTSGTGITAGYHRFYSHRSFKTNPIIETVMLFFATLTMQSSALKWASDHRNHHAFVDTDADPYAITKGFWYAHMLWLFDSTGAVNTKVVSDLMNNKLVMFQHRHYKSLFLGCNAFVWLSVGWLLNDYWGAFFMAVWVRILVVHHCTWFINSLAHYWGSKTFSQEHTAVDNYIIALFTFGEGYHNYHHTFPNDFRNGTRWFHYDPTKWILWTLSKLGLAHALKRMDNTLIKKKIVLEHKSLLESKLEVIPQAHAIAFKQDIQLLSERLLAQISKFAELKEQYQQFKSDFTKQDVVHQLKDELKAYKKHIKQDWRLWMRLFHSVMAHKKAEPVAG